jgi:DNA segregation ATPase FtsK/SpoIIIE-like protein
MLALLDTLKGTIRDFAAREEKLIAGFHGRSAAEVKAQETAIAALTEDRSAQFARAEQSFAAEKAKWQAHFDRRKRRIDLAHSAVKKQVMEDVSGREGRRKYKVQESTLQSERHRDAALADAAAARDEFHRQLGENREGFVQLEIAAAKTFSAYGAFRKLLADDRPWPEPDLAPDENKLLDELRRLQNQTRDELERFRKIPLLLVFKFAPVWLLTVLALGFAGAVPLLRHYGIDTFSLRDAGIAVGALFIILIVYQFGKRLAAPSARLIAGNLAKARRLHNASFEKAELHHQQEQQRIQTEFQEAIRNLNQQWRQAVKEAVHLRGSLPVEVNQKAQRVYERNERCLQRRLKQLEHNHKETLVRINEEADARQAQSAAAHAAKMAALEKAHEDAWQALAAEWRSRIQPMYDSFRDANAAAVELFPDWQAPVWEKWAPPHVFMNAAKFARLEVDVEKLAETLPKDKRLALPGPASVSVPLNLAYPFEGSILFETSKAGSDEAVAAINTIIFRLLSAVPPGKASFTIIDPVGLGQNFAALMHLADYEEAYINGRIWTQSGQIEEKLAELNEHMEKVIQMYLRNEYATITEYNAQAGSIAEKYHFLVIASFPVNFTDTAARRLRNIAASGARCGVYTLVHWDQRHALPHDFVPDELRKNSLNLVHTGKGFQLAHWRTPGAQLVLDAPPDAEFATRFLHEVGRSGKDSQRVEVPFEEVAPSDSDVWTETTAEVLRVPIGRTGATKLQYLEIGKGTRQHALIAGKTGSGKSTLFHVIITNLSMWCSPEQVEFYLVDFKKGVEFKCYATRRLPHAKVVAIESDRQFGLSVLQRVDEELRRRGDLFRKLGVQDVAGYIKAGGTEPIPRSLLIIDEFQEFFTEEDRVSQGAAVLLDRIVRQGRAFGIHVLLGSQTLGGAYTLARATIGQMVIRIALQCNEADAYLIMDQENPAPRLLSRPGEGIYNDAAGAIEGNSPFQTVWLPEDVRDRYLAKVRARADQAANPPPGPFVFEGNAPADVRENLLLRAQLGAKPATPPPQARIWLGAPNAVKGPTEAVFQRQSGSNLLIVGQSEERALTLLAVALVSLSAQYPKGAARFVVLDSTPPGFPQREFLQRVVGAIPHEIIPATNSNLAEVMSGLAEDLKRSEEGPETFVFIHGLENFKKLRQEDEFGFSSGSGDAGAQPAAVLQNLISDGPARGIHVIATCDTYGNVTRFLGRKAISEFEMRVLFQMSAADSASLIDAPDASTLGMHRAVLYNDRETYIETFRPYALPGNEWIEDVAQSLKR